MRVLICIDSLGVGGKERQAVALTMGLLAANVSCEVVCFEASDFYLPDLVNAAVQVHWCVRRSRWDPTIFPQLRRIISKFRPDVIQTNGLVSSFYALPLAKMWRVPLINGSKRVVQLVNCSNQALLGAADAAGRGPNDPNPTGIVPVFPREGTWVMEPFVVQGVHLLGGEVDVDHRRGPGWASGKGSQAMSLRPT